MAFQFVGDYYQFLTQRDFGGYMQNVYQDAIRFAKRPNGQSVFDNTVIDNHEGDEINYVGCVDCFFDEPSL